MRSMWYYSYRNRKERNKMIDNPVSYVGLLILVVCVVIYIIKSYVKENPTSYTSYIVIESMKVNFDNEKTFKKKKKRY
jgi:hypothetical protein